MYVCMYVCVLTGKYGLHAGFSSEVEQCEGFRQEDVSAAVRHHADISKWSGLSAISWGRCLLICSVVYMSFHDTDQANVKN